MVVRTDPCMNTDVYNSVIKNVSIVKYSDSSATIGCSFLDNNSFHCMVCYSTDPSVPPDTSVCYISYTKGKEVTVNIGTLTSGQIYYCKAAATDTGNSTNCYDPVIGGVKMFFSFAFARKMAGKYCTYIIGMHAKFMIKVMQLLL